MSKYKTARAIEKLGPRLRVRKMTDRGAEVFIQNVRIVWPNISRPSRSTDPQIAPSYGLVALIPKKHQQRFEKELRVIVEGMKKTVQFPEKLWEKALKRAFDFDEKGALLKDGDRENDDGESRKETKGCITLRPTSKVDPKSDGEAPRPRVPFELKTQKGGVLYTVEPEQIDDVFYGGIWCDLRVTFVPYNTAGNVGIACFFNGAVKLANDERLDGSEAFTEARSDIPSDDEDEDSDTDTDSDDGNPDKWGMNDDEEAPPKKGKKGKKGK